MIDQGVEQKKSRNQIAVLDKEYSVQIMQGLHLLNFTQSDIILPIMIYAYTLLAVKYMKILLLGHVLQIIITCWINDSIAVYY